MAVYREDISEPDNNFPYPQRRFWSCVAVTPRDVRRLYFQGGHKGFGASAHSLETEQDFVMSINVEAPPDWQADTLAKGSINVAAAGEQGASS